MQVRRAPGFTTVVVLTLGVGLGLATAIFVVLKKVVVNLVPYPDADGLIVLLNEVPGSVTDDAWFAPMAHYFHFRDIAEILDDTGVKGGGFPSAFRAPTTQSRTRADMALATVGVHRWLVRVGSSVAAWRITGNRRPRRDRPARQHRHREKESARFQLRAPDTGAAER